MPGEVGWFFDPLSTRYFEIFSVWEGVGWFIKKELFQDSNFDPQKYEKNHKNICFDEKCHLSRPHLDFVFLREVNF